MRRTHAEVYVHLVWSTWDRQPLVGPGLRQALYACMRQGCRELGCQALAVGGTEDHVHLLVRMVPQVSISELAKQVKGSSSHLATHQLGAGGRFRWQGGFGATTVTPGDVPHVARYIAHQKEHHAADTADEELEAS